MIQIPAVAILFCVGILLGASLVSGILWLLTEKPESYKLAVLLTQWLILGVLLAIWNWGKM